MLLGQNTTEVVIPEYHDVLRAQSGCECMDTEKGSIEVVCANLPDVLPLCITQADLDDWYVCVAVKGGYDPISGSITLCQKKEYKGLVEVEWIYKGHEPCYTDYWCATFKLPDGVDSIELDSNQWPDGAVPVVDNPTIPGKCVILSWCSLWKGCDDRNQMFTIIPTHKSDVFRVPNSE